MVKNAISDYSSTAASNTDVGGVNVDEGMPPSSINNAIREIMSHLADLNAGSSSLGTIKVDNLQLDGNAITSTDTDGDITITPNGNGNVVLDGINYPQVDGTANYFLKTNGAGQLSFAQVGSASIVDNSIGATQLNVSGNGTSGQVLASDADGSFSWADSASPHSYNSVSGTTPSLDVGSYNFFNSGALTGNTTLSFTNVPTEAKWTYTFRTAYGSGNYDVSKMKHTGSKKAVFGAASNAIAVQFNNDGTKFYTYDENSPYHITEWTTPNAWRFQYATITHILDVNDDIAETAPEHMTWGDSGTKLYLTGRSNDSVIQYNLTTAYDLSTATYDSSTSISAQTTSPYGIAFKSDGTKMYILDGSTKTILQYSLSTAWDSSTLSYDSVSVDLSTNLVDTVRDLHFSSDGTKLYTISHTNYDIYNTYSLSGTHRSNALHQFSLSTAWDLSTTSFVRAQTPSQTYQGNQLYPLSGIQFYTFAMSNDGKYVATIDSGEDALNLYELADLYTLTLPSSVQNYPAEPYRPDHTVSLTFYTADGGTNVYLVDQQQFPNK